MTLTYLNFLILFVITPMLVLGFIFRRDLTARWWRCVAALSVVAVVWTTPWDNYLVATDIWWYDEALVLGIVFGYVPLEEYAFFVLQTVLTSIILIALINRMPAPQTSFKARNPLWGFLPAAALSVMVLLMLVSGDRRFNYLILEIGWLALLPLTIQWVWGWDVLLHYWRPALLAILLPTVWLTGMDGFAIHAGTWQFHPDQITGIKIGHIPIEEAIFFLITNTLIVQGFTLFYAPESWQKLEDRRRRLSARQGSHDFPTV